MRTVLISLYDYFTDYLSSPDWDRVFLIVKFVSAIISSLLLIALFFLIFQLRKNIKKSIETTSKSVGVAKLSVKKANKEWNAVLKKLETSDESNLKLAVIEADKILDNILKKSGWSGGSMGERLKQINTSQIANIDAVWQAHKIRNNIVHDPDFRLTRSQAEDAVKIYQKALGELQAV